MSYTEPPTQMAGIVFPNQSMQALSSIIHLLGCSVLAFCLARRTKNLLSWETWSSMTWPRLCVLLVFADSWLFLFSTGILISGAGMSSSFLNCALGIYACVLLYAFSKVMIYCFLMEKVHIVWGGTHQSRFQSKVYWLCLVTMMPYAAIVIIMLVGRVAFFRADRACIIGLKKYASLSLLIYDLYINVFLTGMFLWPLFQSRLANPRIRKMAMRTLVAAGAALTTSTINIAVLTIMHGQQLGWVCLGSCGADVTMNALVLFWVTDNVAASAENTPATAGVVPPTHGAIAAASNVSIVHDDGGLKSPTRLVLPGHVQSKYADSMYDYTSRARPRMESVVFSKEQRGNDKGGKGARILGRIGEVFRSRQEDEERTHQMSVQVTITTEQQGDDIMLHDVKYNHAVGSVDHSIGAGQDLEKGDGAGRV